MYGKMTMFFVDDETKVQLEAMGLPRRYASVRWTSPFVFSSSTSGASHCGGAALLSGSRGSCAREGALELDVVEGVGEAAGVEALSSATMELVGGGPDIALIFFITHQKLFGFQLWVNLAVWTPYRRFYPRVNA